MDHFKTALYGAILALIVCTPVNLGHLPFIYECLMANKVISYNDPQFDILEANLEQEFGLPRGIMRGIRTKGERSNSNQVSPKGAAGVYQIMPATWKTVMADRPSAKPTDSDEAALAAARYLSRAMKETGTTDIGALLAEYNGGRKVYNRYVESKARTGVGDPGNDETRKYIAAVLPTVKGQIAPSNGTMQASNAFTDGIGDPFAETSDDEHNAILDDVLATTNAGLVFNPETKEYESDSLEAEGYDSYSPFTDTDNPFADDTEPTGSELGFSAEQNEDSMLTDRIGQIVDSVLNNG